MKSYEIGDIIEMPKEQFELIDLVIENKWLVTNQNDAVLFVESADRMGGVCHTGIYKRML